MKPFLVMSMVFWSTAILGGQEALVAAIIDGQLDAVAAELDTGIDINAPAEKTLNPLMVAAREGKTEIVGFLLDHGADVNAVEDYDAKSAIHFAAQNGHSAIIQLLGDGGAQIDIGALPMGETPVSIAASRGHLEAVRVLAALGADVNRSTPVSTALIRAVERADVAMVGIFIKAGADPMMTTMMGVNALDLAREKNLEEIISLLEMNSSSNEN